MTSDTFLYFAYGSNMSLARLRASSRAPSADPIGPARWPGHRLVFDMPSGDGSAKANARATGLADDVLHGGLFAVAHADAAALDLVEGVAGPDPAYRRATATVIGPDGQPLDALVYLAVRQGAGRLRPYPWYLRHILVGARELGLPDALVDELSAWPTQPDPDAQRNELEHGLHAVAQYRRERPADARRIARVITAAFAHAPHASGQEARIVERLRAEDVLGTAWVALLDGDLIGHVATSPVEIAGQTGTGWHGLGPVAVAPSMQRRGVGARLVEQALDDLRSIGAAGCVVLGDPSWYRRFGFRVHPGLSLPGVPSEYFQALVLHRAAGEPPRGSVRYHPAFTA